MPSYSVSFVVRFAGISLPSPFFPAGTALSPHSVMDRTFLGAMYSP